MSDDAGSNDPTGMTEHDTVRGMDRLNQTEESR